MFSCKICGKEFDDWHAVGGHMRKHRERKNEKVYVKERGKKSELIGQALERLSEISPEEAWQIVINWIMDVYRQTQLRDDIIQTYRVKIQENESKVDAVQSQLRRLREMVVDGHVYRATHDQL